MPSGVIVLSVETKGNGDGYALVHPDGDLDAATVMPFRQAVAALTDAGALVIDLADVRSIDPVGLGAIVGGLRSAREHGTRVAVARARPEVREMLHDAGMERIVNLTDTLEEAAEAVHQPS